MPDPRRPFAGLEKVDFTGLRLRLIDAENQIIGRLGASLSVILQGKDKPVFAPNKDLGDICVVVNAEKAVFTGNKWEGKLYRWHTGYPGGLKEITARELWRRDPTEILRRTVYGMLPKNNLRDARMRKLRVYAGPQHPFSGVELLPWHAPPRKLQDKGLGWQLPQGFEPMNPEAYAQRMRGSRLVQQGGQQQQQQLEAGQAATDDSSGHGLAGFEELLTAEEMEFVRNSSSRKQSS
ncbi:mitochondrial ribosomal protein L13 [Scenedesmus sp. NREL 46B-D3]|nr:mitochondrial ribosomal protein L13 [Scenedesmus sp. NREL 46B-D3]